MFLTIASPRPVPSRFPRDTKGSNSEPWISGGIPGPSSVTSSLRLPTSRVLRSAIVPPEDSSTEAALLKLATWTPIVGVFGLLAVQALTSFAIVRYFRTVAPEHGHVWKTFVAPLVGGGLMVFSAYLLLHNREALAAGDPFVVKSAPWIILAVFVLGVGAALWFRARDAARYAAVGRFVHEEA